MLSDQSIHLLDVRILFIEKFSSIDLTIALLRATQQFTQSLERAPEAWL